MGLNYPRDNGKVFFIFRVLMNINEIHSPFLCFSFPLGSETTGEKLSGAGGGRSPTSSPPLGTPPSTGRLQQPRAFPCCLAGQRCLQVESNRFPTCYKSLQLGITNQNLFQVSQDSMKSTFHHLLYDGTLCSGLQGRCLGPD